MKLRDIQAGSHIELTLESIQKLLENAPDGVNANYTIAIDMDGVLADFDAGSRKALGKNKDTMPTRDFWKGITHYDKDVEPFFENLPAMKDAFKLMHFITSNFKEYFVLTASGFTPKNVEEQKRNWAKNVFSPHLKVVTVKKSADKAQYANPNTILVDDRRKSIDPWIAAGGIGILHNDAENTIAQLNSYLNKD